MNIAYISNSFIPSRTANSIHVMKMCQAFSNNGHNVTLFVPDARKELEQGVVDIFDYYDVEHNFVLQKVRWPNIKGNSYIFGFLAAKAAAQQNPDIVYCRHLAGCYFSTLQGQKVIFEVHSPIANASKLSKFRELLFKKLINSNKLQGIVVITHSLKKYYEKHYPQLKGKIIVAPDGADAVSVDMQVKSLETRHERLQVGYVGHLYKGKGMEVLSQLAPLCPWADFHVVGGAKEDILFWQQHCESIVNLYFHGYVPHKKAVKFINTFDVVLLPNQRVVHPYGTENSNIGEWTSPLKLFEYMSNGKAILASRLPVLGEILTDGVNGLLCDPEDVSEWMNALMRLNGDHALAERLSKQALEDFNKKYTWRIRAKSLVDSVDKI